MFLFPVCLMLLLAAFTLSLDVSPEVSGKEHGFLQEVMPECQSTW